MPNRTWRVRDLLRNSASYQRRVLNLFGGSFVDYWRLSQGGGTNVVGLVNGLVAVATGLDWQFSQGPKDGEKAARFDGVNDSLNLHSAQYATLLNGNEGAFLCWANLEAAGWTDGLTHFLCNIQNAAGDKVNAIRKTAGGDIWFQSTIAGDSGVVHTPTSPAGWCPFGISWSQAANQFLAYFGAGQVGATKTYSGGWVGASALANVVGSGPVPPSSPWLGGVDHIVMLNRPLISAAEWAAFAGA